MTKAWADRFNKLRKNNLVPQIFWSLLPVYDHHLKIMCKVQTSVGPFLLFDPGNRPGLNPVINKLPAVYSYTSMITWTELPIRRVHIGPMKE
jgi:hypothetical protein